MSDIHELAAKMVNHLVMTGSAEAITTAKVPGVPMLDGQSTKDFIVIVMPVDPQSVFAQWSIPPPIPV